MARTAYDEQYGKSLALAVTGDFQLPAPSGIGGARLFSLSADLDGYDVWLPDARDCALGSQITVHVTRSFNLVDAAGGMLVTLTANQVADCYLIANGTLAGTWVVQVTVGAALAGGVTIGRVVYDLRFDDDRNSFNLRGHLLSIGWDGTSPVAARVTLGADVTFGAGSTSLDWGFATNIMPAGSTLLLILEAGATIAGRGGDGGAGGSDTGGITGAFSGGPGGAGLRIEMNTALINGGIIQGGGGGGGGGGGTNPWLQPLQAGGGGGGGAGYVPSFGGAAGSGGGATAGLPGTLYVAGGGGLGYYAGGPGGGPGQRGTPGRMYSTPGPVPYGDGGEPGDAIQRWTGATLTKIVAGTIVGAEVTF